MSDGVFAFMFLAVVVWFFLGMINPIISMPPFLLRAFEPEMKRATRKIIFQWSCIFMCAVMLTVIIAEFTSREKIVPPKVKPVDMALTKLAIHHLIVTEDFAIRNGKAECVTLAKSHFAPIEMIVKQVLIIEDIKVEEAKKIVALTDINLRINALSDSMRESGCLND